MDLMPFEAMYYNQNLQIIKAENDNYDGLSPKQSAKGQMCSFLPPCRICGDKASGFHYGANTCEACKGFFRRSIVREQKDANFKYRCVNGKKCVLTVGKLRLCAYCRYKKCLSIGMSKRAIKQGRYTHERRTQYINEVKFKHEVKTEPLMVPVDDHEEFSLVDNLLSLQEKYTTFKELPDINHNNEISDKNAWTQESKVLRGIVGIFENSVTLLVEFMRCIPGFTELHFHDQSELLKGSHSDFFLLGEINTSRFDACQERQPFYKCPIHHLYSLPKLQDVYKFVEKSRSLSINKEETCLLRAIAVLSTDRVELYEPHKVEEMQWYCVNCLLRLSSRYYVNPNQRLWQLLDRITTLRTLSPDY